MDKSKLWFIRSFQYKNCIFHEINCTLCRNLPKAKYFHLVVFVRIRRDPPVLVPHTEEIPMFHSRGCDNGWNHFHEFRPPVTFKLEHSCSMVCWESSAPRYQTFFMFFSMKVTGRIFHLSTDTGNGKCYFYGYSKIRPWVSFVRMGCVRNFCKM